MTSNLKDQLLLKGLIKLVTYRDNKEHVLGISPFQLSKIKMQGRYVLKVLTIVLRSYAKNRSFT